MSQDKSLLDLYKLLWEQIKDDALLRFGLCSELDKMYISDVITIKEFTIIVGNIREQIGWGYGWPLTHEGTEQRKEFVQRMIKELEDGNK